MATVDADGHVIEPADLWERELPPRFSARGFHIRWDAETEQEQVWAEERLLLPVGIVGVGMAGRPFEDVGKGAAVRAVRRAVGELGMRGVFVRPNPCRGRALHDRCFDPLWAAIAEAGVPVGLHPSGAGDLPGALQGLRLDAPIMGHPSIFFIDDLIGFSHLVCGGVLERHPRLTVAVLEAGGGWLAHWFDRFDHFAHVYGWMAPELGLRPSEYFKRQCYISFDPDETTLPLLAPVIGEDRIAWASDYPHLDATYPGVVRELEEQLARLPPA